MGQTMKPPYFQASLMVLGQCTALIAYATDRDCPKAYMSFDWTKSSIHFIFYAIQRPHEKVES